MVISGSATAGSLPSFCARVAAAVNKLINLSLNIFVYLF
jgi:hypothetical protein